ncbi:hypothetical protein IWX63_003313, partial [Arthrobacter sp. CAN_A2]|uniref:hypothetical protein n=1 Tax=Arthrobacter sp. CAN_A2 TaxID=2787718 RepID=UPI0018EF7751
VLGHLPVQDDAPDGPALLVVRQEALTLIPPGETGPSTLKGAVSGITSLGARTLVQVSVSSGGSTPPAPPAGRGPHSLDMGATRTWDEGPAATLTVDVAGNPHLLPGQVVGVGVHEDRGWAVPA